MRGHRIPVPFDGHFPCLEQPGDYCGPFMGYTADKPCVAFLKPNARDVDAPRRARIVQHVTSPPHHFKEESDGSLTVTASISDQAGQDSESDGWHGFLTKGEWIKV